YDYNSGLRVQNVGTGATDIRFRYTFGGQAFENTFGNVQPGQSVGPYLGDDEPSDKPANLPNFVTGAATVESLAGQPLVGIVNEDNRVLGQGASYSLFRADEALPNATIPQVVNKLGNADLDRLNGWYVSGIQYQNVGPAAASCAVTYAGLRGS